MTIKFKVFLLSIGAVLTARAQFSSMATDYAGQRLLFTTNLSQTGSGQPDYGKLFVADWRGVQPLLIYNYVEYTTKGLYPGQTGLVTNPYYVDGVDISSNGAYVSVMAEGACLGYTSLLCGSTDYSTLYDSLGQVALGAAGQVIVSRNGKWALDVLRGLSGSISFSMYDMTTGTRYPIPGVGISWVNFDWRLHSVADDGTAVLSGTFGLFVCRAPSAVPQIVDTGNRNVGPAVIDAAGSVVVWEQPDEFGNSSLFALRTADLTKTTSLRTSGWSDSSPRLSDDGRIILFLSTPTTTNAPPQVFLMAIDGSGRRWVTAEPEGIAKAVLSGNGEVVWALTRTGRLLKIDIASGNRTQYTEPLAAFLAPYYYPNDPMGRSVSGEYSTPGEVLSVPASVMPGEKVDITVQGQPATVVKLDPGVVVFQVPWIPIPSTGRADVPVVIRKPDSPSWSGDKLNLTLQAPPPTLLTSVHQDFSALITAAQPAWAGEIIHLYGVGFGPVAPPVPDGAPTPISPLSTTVSPVTCDVWNQAGIDSGSAVVLFAGLAPGMLGIYQLDVRLPAPLPEGGSIQVRCHVDSQTGIGIDVPVQP